MGRWYGEFIAVVVCNRLGFLTFIKSLFLYTSIGKSQRLTTGSVYRLCLTQWFSKAGKNWVVSPLYWKPTKKNHAARQ